MEYSPLVFCLSCLENVIRCHRHHRAFAWTAIRTVYSQRICLAFHCQTVIFKCRYAPLTINRCLD